MFAAAGIVVTEIRTPTRAPDFALVSERMPAAPAKIATRNENSSGCEMKWVFGWNDGREAVGGRADPVDREREQEGGRDPDREADRERQQRALDQVGPALDEGDAEAGDRPELRPDDHRSDDQDRRVEDHSDRGDQAGQHHEHQEARRRAPCSPRSGPRPPPRRRRPTAAPFAASSARSAASEIWESMSSIAIDPSLWIPNSLQVARRSRWRPRARRRRGSRRLRASGRPPRGGSGCRPRASPRAAASRALSACGRSHDSQVDHAG